MICSTNKRQSRKRQPRFAFHRGTDDTVCAFFLIKLRPGHDYPRSSASKECHSTRVTIGCFELTGAAQPEEGIEIS